jgi:hypothetical protein
LPFLPWGDKVGNADHKVRELSANAENHELMPQIVFLIARPPEAQWPPLISRDVGMSRWQLYQ